MSVEQDTVGNGAPQRQIAAAGGLLWRNGERGLVEVIAVWRPKVGNWSLPKGKLDPGEHPLTAACREVEEETGIPVIPQMKLCRASYVLPNPAGDVLKYVDYWSMRTEKPDAAFTADEEIGERRWITLAEAREALTRPRDQQVLKAFGALPAVTATVILVAPAEVEQGWDGPDVTRPLSARGQDQAVRVAALASLYQPDRAFSATGRASVQTVEPIAQAVRCRLGGDSAFDTEAHERNPERSSARIRELAGGGGTAIVCAEPEVVSDTVAILADEDGVETADVSTRSGEAWVLSLSGQKLVGVERL
ncbi:MULTISPECIES: NUDIX hydrolase [Glycomyces]|uniref:8-oxo-dGTP diphosphatase n=1 Tax=Glycomyces lechevalierae TaxID=256034 RepID=A0A9X3PJ96_9ACTN|nr:NUDIX hydrolase [Glycomyces lechevalierae]MDA1384791.1 NUDIX hydrolase [Glycomyces lechevalierae]MDR7337756.1 8-oxo-dGTP diphosphatase [Glycomyces lechevalierae]